MKHTLTICTALLISACANAPTTPLEPQTETLSAGMARVYFLRDSTGLRRGKLVRIKVNAKGVGNVASGSSFFVDRSPGVYRVSVETLDEPGESAIDVHLDADKRYYMQVAAYERQGTNPDVGGAVAVVMGGALGGAVGGLLDTRGPVVFGVTPLRSEVGEALLRKLK